jgi:hypothetical protein
MPRVHARAFNRQRTGTGRVTKVSMLETTVR